MTISEIAKKFEMSSSGVRKRMKKLGIQTRSLTEAQELQHRNSIPDGFSETYISGAPLKEIMERFDITMKTIYNWKNKLGLPNRNSSRNTVPDGFSEAYLRGDTLESLYERFDCSWATLYHWRDMLGLPKRKGPPSD